MPTGSDSQNVLSPTPAHLRQGQSIYCFLSWLANVSSLPRIEGHDLADPFYIPDDQFNSWWHQYVQATEMSE